MRAIAQRLVELNAQAAQIVMIAAKTDFGHLMRRNTAQIGQLILEAAVDMRLQQRRDLLAG